MGYAGALLFVVSVLPVVMDFRQPSHKRIATITAIIAMAPTEIPAIVPSETPDLGATGVAVVETLDVVSLVDVSLVSVSLVDVSLVDAVGVLWD